MSLYHNAVGLFAVCDYGMSWPYSLAFYVRSLFNGVVISVLSSLAVNLLRKNKLVVILSKYLVAV